MTGARAGAIRFATVVLVAAHAGCGDHRGGAPSEDGGRVTLGGDEVARVGGQVVSGTTVARIAAAQSLSPRDALDRAVFDALLAAEAESRLSEGSRGFEESRVLARAMIAELAAAARAAGPPTDDEVAKLTEQYAHRVARPDAVLVAHAVVRVPPNADEPTRANARATAEKLREDAKAIADDIRGTPLPPYDIEEGRVDDPAVGRFQSAALKAAPPGVTIKPELFLLGIDGATISKNGRMPLERAFVDAAVELERGDLGPIAETRFGFHVILGISRMPGNQLGLEERRAHFADRIYADRTRALTRSLVEGLRAKTDVEIERSADDLLSQLRIAPEGDP